jgi:glycosyltransferase involved in cell wall biosynthesis
VIDGRPLRVCHIITRLIVGGAQEGTVYACAFVSKDEFRSLLVTGLQTGVEGDLGKLARKLGVSIVGVDSLVREIAPIRDLRALCDLRSVLREHRPDIVHTHSSKAGVLGRLAARREGVPIVVHTVHGWGFHGHMPALSRAVFVRLERRAAVWSDRLITVSDLDRDKGLAARIGTTKQYRTIPNLNDLRRYFDAARRGAAARARLELPASAFVVGTVGRLAHQKDPTTWVRTAARVAADVPDARFVMVGDGDLRAHTQRLAAKLGIGDRLVLTGLRDDVPDILPAFDVFLLTSRWEGLPLVIPQAMASGVPVVVSAADGNRAIVRDGENGLVAPPEAADSFAASVVRLRDAKLASRLVAAGRETAHEFSLERTIPSLENLYRECAAEKFGVRTYS